MTNDLICQAKAIMKSQRGWISLQFLRSRSHGRILQIRAAKHYKVRMNHEEGDFVRVYKFREDPPVDEQILSGKDRERRIGPLTSLRKMKIFC